MGGSERPAVNTALNNPQKSQTFTPVATGTFLVAAGAVGWLDTDVSTTTGTDINKIWFIVTRPYAADLVQGARPLGGGVDNKCTGENSIAILSKVSASGHMELYRNASNCDYQIVGYWL